MSNDDFDLEKLLGDGGGSGSQMVRQSEAHQQVVAKLVQSDKRSEIIEYLMRTVFDNRLEMMLFREWVSWCVDFNVPLEDCLYYVAARPSVGGLAREQLVKAVTPFARGFHTGDDSGKRQKDDNRLSP